MHPLWIRTPQVTPEMVPRTALSQPLALALVLACSVASNFLRKHLAHQLTPVLLVAPPVGIRMVPQVFLNELSVLHELLLQTNVEDGWTLKSNRRKSQRFRFGYLCFKFSILTVVSSEMHLFQLTVKICNTKKENRRPHLRVARVHENAPQAVFFVQALRPDGKKGCNSNVLVHPLEVFHISLRCGDANIPIEQL